MTDSDARQVQQHLQRLQGIKDLSALAAEESRRRQEGMSLEEAHAFAMRRSQLVEARPRR